jgi:transcriptional regulator of arginine metabolism
LKAYRHAKIKELIQKHEIHTQRELTALLAAAGLDVTQATVSRDIKSLKLEKTTGKDGGLKFFLPKDTRDISKFKRVFDDGFVSMDYAGNMLVIHTVSGMAGAVGEALDVMDYPEIIGSVAGDNVVMCVIRTESQAAALMEKLRQ